MTAMCRDVWRYGLWAVMCFAVIGVVFGFDLNPFSRVLRVDSSVFLYMGRRMQEGLVPYRDVFDHKGPILYFINYIGLQLGGTNGVWLIEVLGFGLSTGYLFKWLTSRFGDTVACLAVSASCVLFLDFFTGGNMTETYAYYFLIPCTCWLCEYAEGERLSWCRWFFVGLSVGVILCLRPNMVSIGLIYAVLVLVQIVRTRSLAPLSDAVLPGLAGLCLAVVTCLVYLKAHDALAAMWETYILFNVKYASGGGIVLDRPFDLYFFLGVVTLNGVEVLLLKDKKLRAGLLANLVFLTLSLVVVVSKMRYYHYYVVVLPACLFPVAVLLWKVASCRFNRLIFAALSSWTVLKIVYMLFATFIDCNHIKDRIATYGVRYVLKLHRKEAAANVPREIVEGIKNKSSVQIIGNSCQDYVHYGLSTPWKYPYLTGMSVDEGIRSEVLQSIQLKRAECIIIPESYTDEELKRELFDAYELSHRAKGFDLYRVRK